MSIPRLVAQVDHVVLQAGDEQTLFSFFADTLGLPVAWPIESWDGVIDGGINVGDCNIGCIHPLDPSQSPTPMIRAVSLEPDAAIEVVHDELTARGLAPSTPIPAGPFDLPAEMFAPFDRGWTNVYIGALMDPSPLAFFCDYHHDTTARRAAQVEQLARSGGGPLGITGLHAIVLYRVTAEKARMAWRELLTPATETTPGCWELDTGPRLVIEPTEHDGAALTFAVRSLSAARDALDDIGISHHQNDATGVIHLDQSGTLGLDLRITG